jgi:hypothetical protein
VFVEGVQIAPQSVSQDVGMEGSLNNWNILYFGFEIRD